MINYCAIFTIFAAVKHLWIALLSVLAVACHDDIELPPATLKQVVVVYMMAENSLSSYASKDLNEIRQAAAVIPDSCALVVYYDEANSNQQPRILRFDRTGEHVVYQYREDPISTDSTFMQQTLAFITSSYPAEHYGLVMWSHGSGWLPQTPRRTIGVDNGNNSTSNVGTEMEISTMANILRKSGCHWDYVLFDACFMQCVEVAYELRDVTEWCIGSPAEIPGTGAPYHSFMGELFLDSDNAWKIAQKYYEYYQFNKGLVISAIKTDKMEQLAETTAPLLASLPEYPNTDDVQIYVRDLRTQPWYTNYHDMGSAMNHWLSSDIYSTWLNALEEAVPHRFATSQWDSSFTQYFTPVVADPDHIACLSMYIPIENGQHNEHYTNTAWWKRMRR